jgi:hypothetical protein
MRLFPRIARVSGLILSPTALASGELAEKHGTPLVTNPRMVIAVAGMAANLGHRLLKDP